jgi:methylated-DNA-[protein]-cysteine S-methyltransferase
MSMDYRFLILRDNTLFMTQLEKHLCATINTPFGVVTLATADGALIGVWFEGQKHHPNPKNFQIICVTEDALMDESAEQLLEYFAGTRAYFTIPLDLSAGTVFHRAVWHELLKIPFGATCSYATISRAIKKPNAARAVGSAIARNPCSIFVPCHRVVGSNGQLTGFDGGVALKQSLLQLEQRILVERGQG